MMHAVAQECEPLVRHSGAGGTAGRASPPRRRDRMTMKTFRAKTQEVPDFELTQPSTGQDYMITNLYKEKQRKKKLLVQGAQAKQFEGSIESEPKHHHVATITLQDDLHQQN